MLRALGCAHRQLWPLRTTLTGGGGGGGEGCVQGQGVGTWPVPKAGKRRRLDSEPRSEPGSAVHSVRAAIGSQRPRPAQPSSFLRKTIKEKQRRPTGWGAPRLRAEAQSGHVRASSCRRKHCPPAFVSGPLRPATSATVTQPTAAPFLGPQHPESFSSP